MSGLSDFFFGYEVEDEPMVEERTDLLPEPTEQRQTTDPNLSEKYATAKKTLNKLKSRKGRDYLKNTRMDNLNIVGPTDEEQMV